MKLYLREMIPLEVWTNVNKFTWISRREMAWLVIQLGSRHFAEILQFFLHDQGKITLKSSLGFTPRHQWSESPHRALLESFHEYECEIAQTPIPNNIKDFEEIRFSYFDGTVLNFCYKFRALFSDVNLFFDFSRMAPARWHNVAIAFKKLLPIIGRIRSVSIYCDSEGEHCFDWAIRQPAFQAAIAQVQMLAFCHYDMSANANAQLVTHFAQWLTSPAGRAANGRPKMAMLEFGEKLYTALIAAIKEAFLAATVPSTFAIYFNHFRIAAEFQFQVENGRTGEQLVIRSLEDDEVEICRHRIGAEAELRGWIEENKEFHWASLNMNRKLIFLDGPTIGESMKKKLRLAKKKKKLMKELMKFNLLDE